MPNGDLHVDFRDFEVADTVGCNTLAFHLSNSDFIGVSRASQGAYCWGWQCPAFLVRWPQALKILSHFMRPFSEPSLSIPYLIFMIPLWEVVYHDSL